MPRSVRLLAGTGNGLAAIQRFQPAHDARRVFGERGITASQMLHRRRAVLAVIHRLEISQAQQLGQLARVDRIALVARLQQSILARIAHHQMRHSSHQQIVQPRRVRAFFEGDVQRPTQSAQKIQNGRGAGGDHRLHHQLTVSVQHCHRDGVTVDIQTHILDAIHRVFLSSGLAYCFDTAAIAYFERGALL